MAYARRGRGACGEVLGTSYRTRAMSRKKPGLQISGPEASCSSSFSLSDTGSFAKENFVVGSHGITQSPLSQGEVSDLRLEHVDLGALIGRGATSRVYVATHRPSGKHLALKVLQADIEGSRESRHMVHCHLANATFPHSVLALTRRVAPSSRVLSRCSTR